MIRCWLFGHADGAPKAIERGLLGVQCSECGRLSVGVPVGRHRLPITTERGFFPTIVDAFRLYKIRRAA